MTKGAFLQWSRGETGGRDPGHGPKIVSRHPQPVKDSHGAERGSSVGARKQGWPGALGTGHSLLSRLPRRRRWQQCVLWHVPRDIMGRHITHQPVQRQTNCVWQAQLCAPARHYANPTSWICLKLWLDSAHGSEPIPPACCTSLTHELYPSCTHPVGTHTMTSDAPLSRVPVLA